MEQIEVMGLAIPAAIYLPVLYLVLVAALLVVKKVLFVKLRSLARRTATRVDEVLLSALSLPLTLLILAGTASLLDHLFQLGDTLFPGQIDAVLRTVTIVALIIFFDKFLRNLTDSYSGRIKVVQQSQGVLRILVHIVVLGIGLLMIMDSFGISITPLIASLGIGSLAVALALQPTLENFFGGVQIVTDRPITVGQFVKLDSGEEGYVEKIGWRSTWVRMLQNNVVVLPNKILVNSKLINYYYPSKEMSVLVQVGVHYDSDLEHVEEVTVEVARETLKECQGGVAEFEPFIRYHTFDSSSINFTVILRAEEFTDSYRIKHEFIKRLHERYKKEGIVIPYPLVTLDWNDNSSPVRISRE